MSRFTTIDLADSPEDKPRLVPGASPIWRWRGITEWRQEEVPPEPRLATPIDGSEQSKLAGEVIIQVLG